jgi:hypothetical protein
LILQLQSTRVLFYTVVVARGSFPHLFPHESSCLRWPRTKWRFGFCLRGHRLLRSRFSNSMFHCEQSRHWNRILNRGDFDCEVSWLLHWRWRRFSSVTDQHLRPWTA